MRQPRSPICGIAFGFDVSSLPLYASSELDPSGVPAGLVELMISRTPASMAEHLGKVVSCRQEVHFSSGGSARLASKPVSFARWVEAAEQQPSFLLEAHDTSAALKDVNGVFLAPATNEHRVPTIVSDEEVW